MRKTDCYRLSKILLPELPEFATNKKSEIFICPINHVLRGFTFESSAYSREDFYFWWFFMPINKPIEYITLSYGKRLEPSRGHAGWRTDLTDLPNKLLAAMDSIAVPFLRSIESIDETIEAIYARCSTKEVADINVLDDVACLHILAGQFDEAKVVLDKIIDHEYGSDCRQWVLDIVKRMKDLRTKLLQDPQLSINQVKEWQDYTLRALNLEKWR
jgi:hypothetical protein